MCGIAGILEKNIEIDTTRSILARMANSIKSRGPDDLGVWVDQSGVGLAHRRLSIVDLTAAGHQPMSSSCGRYTIVFNGEIYNHIQLRLEIEQCLVEVGEFVKWRGSSDTETLLAAFSIWGVSGAIQRCIGMFAFAVWDKCERTLTLGRDRLGEKPLYYGWQGDGLDACFLFGSELKAIKQHPKFSAKIDRGALSLFMRLNYIPAPYSIYEGIFKLQPGSLLTVSLNHKVPVISPFWSLTETAINGNLDPLTGHPETLIDQLEELLLSAVGQQMVADVPLGAFLSGGVDSSTIVALMQAQSERPVKTFTIGFSETDFDEAPYANAIAQHLGTDHHELYVGPNQALEVIPQLPSLFCEPFADASQIPTFLVSQLARQNVTVCLSGDGGDELFAGYNRYIFADQLWKKLSPIPKVFREFGAEGIRSISPSAWNVLLEPIRLILPKSLRQNNIGDKLHKGAKILPSSSLDNLYLSLMTQWEPSELVVDGHEPDLFPDLYQGYLKGLNGIQRMMLMDSASYLPDDILVKVDRAGMGVSLEGRMPFLDHRVVEFAWRVPLDFKLRAGNGKWLLRQVLDRYVPKDLIERPKMGFGVPLDAWLRGPLRSWAEDLLDEDRLKEDGFFHVEPILTKWKEHLSCKRNWQNHLWPVLMFQAWLREQS